jgi:peptide/nickel transport system permease protein
VKWRLAFLAALLLPQAPLHPFDGGLGPAWPHLLGTDDLGRDALLRLLLAGGRSLGFATACALAALVLAWLLAALRPFRHVASSLRGLPPLLFLIPLAAAAGGLGWILLAALLATLMAFHLEAPLRIKLERLRQGPAWAGTQVMGATPAQRAAAWMPWAITEGAALFPSAWLGALWGEATLSALGLGPGPEHDSLGRLLHEELPRLATDPTPLGWAALAMVLALAWSSQPEPSWT